MLAPALVRGIGEAAEMLFPVTLNMQIQFFHRPTAEWILQRTRAHLLQDNYAYGTVELWGECGHLLALVSQRAACRPLRENEKP
jgi:acyl-CoA thioesterase